MNFVFQEAKGLPPQISTEDYFPRYLEFQKFEREFTTCLSQSAVQTKFATHSRKGQQIVKDMAIVMGDVQDNAMKSQKSLGIKKFVETFILSIPWVFQPCLCKCKNCWQTLKTYLYNLIFLHRIKDKNKKQYKKTLGSQY